MSKLLADTLKRLRLLPRNVTYKEVAEETGLTLAWVWRLANGGTPDPSVVKVEKLNEYLRKRVGDRSLFTTRVSIKDKSRL